MWCEEVHLISIACRGMAEHDEEACVFQVHVGINVYKRVASEFNTAVIIFLNSKLIELRTEVGGIVFGEEIGVASKLYQ